MTTERDLDSPRQEVRFHPEDHEDPEHGLTLLIRQLRLGERVRMPNDALVVSRTVPVGSNMQRRFSIIPAPGTVTPQERHRRLTLAHGACKTAEEAAQKAIREGK